jgi:hypothetical protein
VVDEAGVVPRVVEVVDLGFDAGRDVVVVDVVVGRAVDVEEGESVVEGDSVVLGWVGRPWPAGSTMRTWGAAAWVGAW